MRKEQILVREGLIPCWCASYPECPYQTPQATIDHRWTLREKQKTVRDLRQSFTARWQRLTTRPVDVDALNAHIRKVLGL
jgi:hypothetical protein